MLFIRNFAMLFCMYLPRPRILTLSSVILFILLVLLIGSFGCNQELPSAPPSPPQPTRDPFNNSGATIFIPLNPKIILESKPSSSVKSGTQNTNNNTEKSTNNPQLAISGELPNSCYEFESLNIVSPKPNEHHIEIHVHIKSGMCLMVTKHFHATLPLAFLSPGLHYFYLKNSAGNERKLEFQVPEQ